MTNLDPTILVVKKHVSVLANILMWLNKQDGMDKTNKEWEWKEKKWKNDTLRQLLPKFQLACDQPLLVIDDECDSASIDISSRKLKEPKMNGMRNTQENFKKIDPSKTNQLIRRILMCFKRSTYWLHCYSACKCFH